MRMAETEHFISRHGTIEVRRLGISLGAEIRGLDLTAPPRPEDEDFLQAALAEHELLILRDQPIDSEQLMTLGRRFGELSVHPFAPRDSGNPALIKFDNDASTPPYGTDVWHSDETFRHDPPLATILCAKIVPAVGGDTLWASMTTAYAALSERIRRLIDGLEAVHDIVPFKRLFGESAADREKLQAYERQFPPQRHPIVRVHPVTGRKVLFVNPQFTTSIVGMDDNDSRALLEILFRQATTPEFQYRLRWEPDTIAIWDNRSTQHYAVHDYYPQRRTMERVTIAGGPVEGPVAADTGDLKRLKFEAPPGVDPSGGHRPH